MTLNNAITQINQQTGNAGDIKKWIEANVLHLIQGLQEYQKLSGIISSFKFKEIKDNVDLFLSTWQILETKNNLKSNFKKACKYLYYLNEKELYTQTINSFNHVSFPDLG